MEIQYLGTAAAEGWPALFCDCDICHRARKEGGEKTLEPEHSLSLMGLF